MKKIKTTRVLAMKINFDTLEGFFFFSCSEVYGTVDLLLSLFVCLFILFQMAVGYDSPNMLPRDKVKNGFMVSLFTMPLDITSFCHLLNTKLVAQT